MKHSFILTMAAALTASCAGGGRQTYFRDLQADSAIATATPRDIALRPGDKLTVIVNSRDRNLADLFNLAGTGTGHDTGAETTSLVPNTQKYTLDNNGNIDFPVVGTLHVGGISRDSVAKLIKRQLVDRRLLTDAVVNVELANLCVSVLGEVRRPGRVVIDRDRFTIIDALSVAGDLTTNGDRSCILVVRQEGNVRKAYTIDLRSAANLYSSPAYYLSQGDMIYVKPYRAGRGK